MLLKRLQNYLQKSWVQTLKYETVKTFNHWNSTYCEFQSTHKLGKYNCTFLRSVCQQTCLYLFKITSTLNKNFYKSPIYRFKKYIIGRTAAKQIIKIGQCSRLESKESLQIQHWKWFDFTTNLNDKVSTVNFDVLINKKDWHSKLFVCRQFITFQYL